MDAVETIVVGAGVVGLAIASELARSGREVIVLEKEKAFGTETSARNSEVVHGGIYYTPGSLKALLCVEGRHRLVEYCAERGVPLRRCGKLIVAADDSQIVGLQKIEARATASGVDDLRWLEGAEARALEPALRCTRALLSPSTGIIDSHALMLSLLGDAQDHGAVLACASVVERAGKVGDGFELAVNVDGETVQIGCRELVNAAGLGAWGVAAGIDALPPTAIPPRHLAKGNYFSLQGRAPFTRLIYPIPDEAGLGVHLTLDLGGQARFGPDVEWVSAIDYRVDPKRCDGFYAKIREYWPELRDGSLIPAYSGIRPKIVGPEAAAADFRIDGPEAHGLPGLVNLFGIESPGLTSSLAIAVRVREALDRAI